MWLSILAALLKLFASFATAAERAGAMDAGQAVLVARVIQDSLARVQAARDIRDAVRRGAPPVAGPDDQRVLDAFDRSKR